MKNKDHVTIKNIKDLVSEFKNRLEIATELKCEINVFITDKTTTTIDDLYNIMEEEFINNYKFSPKYINKKVSLNNKEFKSSHSEIIAYRMIYCYICINYLNITPMDVITSKLGSDRTTGHYYNKKVSDLLEINDAFYAGVFKKIMTKIGINEKII